MFTALVFGMNAKAEDFSLYYESTVNGSNVEVSAVSQMRKITFKNGVLAVTYKDGTTSTTPLTSIKRLFFSTPATGVEEVSVKDVTKKDAAVYDLMGRKVSESLDGNLPKGIYIVDGKKVLVK